MYILIFVILRMNRSRWPGGLRRRSAAALMLGLRVRIPPGAWMSVCCECCVLSGKDLCDELITRPEQSYRLWCVVSDLETSWMRRSWPALGSSFIKKNINPLTPNDLYIGRTAPLTSKRCIIYIYSTIIVTEYFKHRIYSPFFSLQNAVCFIILTYLVPILFKFYIQSVLKLKNK